MVTQNIMATINLICYKPKTLANGEHPLIKDGNRSYKYLGISVSPKYWDCKKNEPKPNCPNREHILKIIADKKAEYQTQLLELYTLIKTT